MKAMKKSPKEDEFPIVSDIYIKKHKQASTSTGSGRRHRVLYVCSCAAVLLLLLAGGLASGWRQLAARLSRGVGERDAAADSSDVLACYCTGAAGVAALRARLCTHAMVGFAQVRDKRVALSEPLQALLRAAARARAAAPGLKLLLSVGGAGGDRGFSEMVVDHAARKTFIGSLKEVLRNYSLDGVDLDWEFPGVHLSAAAATAGARERQHFSQLLREIRAEYARERRPYLLTVAVAAQEVIASVAYDVPQLDLHADLVSLMTYDFHAFSAYTPFTGFNSPLLARAGEQLYLATLNVNYTVQWYVRRGLRRSKLLVGVPTYAHSFTLVNPDNARPGAPAAGYGELGNFVDYPAVCALGGAAGAALRWDAAARASWLAVGAQWLSPQLPRDAAAKARYVRQEGLRGAMIYSLDSDDYLGVCTGEFGSHTILPLSKSVRNTLMDD